LITDLEQVFEPLGDEESVIRTTTFEKSVGGDGSTETDRI
jgi:hypothetical protein